MRELAGRRGGERGKLDACRADHEHAALARTGADTERTRHLRRVAILIWHHDVARPGKREVVSQRTQPLKGTQGADGQNPHVMAHGHGGTQQHGKT